MDHVSPSSPVVCLGIVQKRDRSTGRRMSFHSAAVNFLLLNSGGFHSAALARNECVILARPNDMNDDEAAATPVA
jgi:hypothetical protein